MGVLMKVQIKFTDNSPKEIAMAREVESHSSKSGFIKDLIWAHIQRQKKLNALERQDDDIPDFKF